ncbi:MAG: aa3-type cytochrome c oxidase subunit IV [Novosphingobium sp.]
MASGNDMKSHESTYGGFMTLLKVVLPIIALIGILVIYLIH